MEELEELVYDLSTAFHRAKAGHNQQTKKENLEQLVTLAQKISKYTQALVDVMK